MLLTPQNGSFEVMVLTHSVLVLLRNFVVSDFDCFGYILIIDRFESAIVRESDLSIRLLMSCLGIIISLKSLLSWFQVGIRLISK